MKNIYQTPRFEIMSINDDVIVTSNQGGGDIDLPPIGPLG